MGLAAQQQAVCDFLAGRGELTESLTEIKSGRKTDRPELTAALDACRRHKATLVIAKLDRLARNVYFISGLMDSGVEFVAVDMPEANRLTIHILATVAEHEREMISQRTKVALQAAKAQGTTSYRAIARALNARGIQTANGRQWHGTIVKNLLQRAIGGHMYHPMTDML